MRKKIVVSIVCYDNVDEVIAFSKQIERQTYKDKIILLVTCNYCKDLPELKQRLGCLNLECHVYEPEKNWGYLKGCLYGIERFAKTSDYDWAVIANTDLYFYDINFFEEMLKIVEDLEVACIAPNIVRKSNGHHQNPFAINRPSRFKVNLWRFVYSNIFIYKVYFAVSHLKRLIKNEEAKNVESQYIYAPHGSIFALDFNSAHALIRENPNIFMYGEELLVGEVLRENKWKTYYIKELKVRHEENETTKFINDIRKQKWSKESFEYLYNRFFFL